MLDQSKSGMQCAGFDRLLSAAIDGTLQGQQRAEFERHKASCAACRTLFAEVSRGAAWLEELEEVEAPPGLLREILAATSGVAGPDAAGLAEPRSAHYREAWERLRRRLGALLVRGRPRVFTPRFGLSVGMAFFSITLVLNMAQIRIRDLTPHNLTHTIYSSENKVRKYYENMRLVYEIESRVRDLRNAGEQSAPEERSPRLEMNHNRSREPKPDGESTPYEQGTFHRGTEWLARQGGGTTTRREL